MDVSTDYFSFVEISFSVMCKLSEAQGYFTSVFQLNQIVLDKL